MKMCTITISFQYKKQTTDKKKIISEIFGSSHKMCTWLSHARAYSQGVLVSEGCLATSEYGIYNCGTFLTGYEHT